MPPSSSSSSNSARSSGSQRPSRRSIRARNAATRRGTEHYPGSGVPERQSERPAYYAFLGTDVNGGSADESCILKLYPGDTWGGLVSEGAVHLVPHRTPGERMSIPATFDRHGRTAISFIPGRSLRHRRTSDPTVPGTSRYVVNESNRMWANSEQGDPPGQVFLIHCRPGDEETVLPGTECLHPRVDLLQYLSEPSLQVEISDNDSHSFDAGGRRLFHLDIISNPISAPATTSDADTLSPAVASLDSLAQRLRVRDPETTNGEETLPNGVGADID
jgi:hypothetical protein